MNDAEILMFRRTAFNEAQAKLDALDRSLAIIEFSLDGTIQYANHNFLTVVGYTLEEIQGKHHRIFVEESVASTADYEAFWTKLRSGDFVSGEFMRLDKAKSL